MSESADKNIKTAKYMPYSRIYIYTLKRETEAKTKNKKA